MSARREILSEAKDVWITHIVTGRRTAHRISASMRVAATRDRKTDGDGIRCCDSLWVTMWVIHTGFFADAQNDKQGLLNEYVGINGIKVAWLNKSTRSK